MYNNYPIINNIILFYKGEFSQWYGALSDNKKAPFKISVSSWSSFFKKWYDEDQFLNAFDIDDTYSDAWDGYKHTFTTCEHAMMFGKAIVFGDFDIAKKILDTSHPRYVKQLGREIKGFNQSWWDKVKLPLVTMINYHKFSQNEDCKNLLLGTGQHILAEASPTDLVWGIGLDANNPQVGYISNWLGQNLLGRALMRVREQLND